MEPSLLFSSCDYYKNTRFQHMMRNWTNYINMCGVTDNPALMFEWYNELMKDWYEYAKEWLEKNKEDKRWRLGCQ